MKTIAYEDDELLFQDQDSAAPPPASKSDEDGCFWKLLVVDDDFEVYEITKLALSNFRFEGKGLQFLHASSGRSALRMVREHPDIALILLDVVMETDDAGLKLVHQIREELGNHLVRIVLRTGQPGQAPEKEIIIDYDINDYTEKSDLSAQRLFTIVVASLRAHRDVLRLDQSRKELLESNQHLTQERGRIQVTLDSIGDAVLTTDAVGTVTHLNPVAELLTGWTLAQASGQPLSTVFEIINAESRQPIDNPVQKVLSTGKTVGLANHTLLISKDKKEYHIADSAAPIQDKSGKILGVVLVCRDVTKAMQTEKALQRSQKMESLGQLTGGIAHDFNNQLNVIVGYLDLLKVDLHDDVKISEWLSTASGAALRCTDLTRQLLSFSRTQTSQREVLNINAKLEDMQSMLAKSVTPEVDLQYFLTADLWPTEIDSGDFQDAILNLVINARDAMPEGGKLVFETSNTHLDADYFVVNPGGEAGDYCQIVLSDTGIGMDRKTQEQVFEPFFTTKPMGKGTGLGLSMVYGFVKRSKGLVKIYSELGGGTTIRLYLPRSQPGSSAIKSQVGLNSELPGGSETILIVDDEAALLQLANICLTGLGYRTYLAANAEQAMAILEGEDTVDLLFSDVVMPGGVNGYELAQQATEKNPQLKVLLTSGFTSKTICHNDLTRFSTTLLNKPYRQAEMAERIRQILDTSVNAYQE